MSIGKLWICTSFWVAILCSGCMQIASVQDEYLSPSELNANASSFDGHDVVVRGFVTLESEGHTLYESQRLNEEFRGKWASGDKTFDPKDFVKYCLTIANPELLYENSEVFSGKLLTVKGKFIAKYLDAHTLDLGACPLPTGIVIDEVDLRRRYPSIKRRGS